MKLPDWMIDELALAGPEHRDDAFVAAYDRKQQFDPTEDIQTLISHGMDSSSIVIDLGAGTGTFALAAARHCKQLIAVDISPTMTSHLERRTAEHNLDNVQIVQAGLLSYQHQGDPVDIVYSRNTLHHLPDFWKGIALERMASILRPGGTLLLHDIVYSFDVAEAIPVIEHWLENAHHDPATGYTRDDLATHIREEYSTFSWLLEPLLQQAGFTIQEVETRGSRTYAAYLCIKRL